MSEQIRTLEELNALPVGAVVSDRYGRVAVVDGDDEQREYLVAGRSGWVTAEYVMHHGPVTVLYRPDDVDALDREDKDGPGYRMALARIAALAYEDHEQYDETDTDLQTAQKRGGTIDRIHDVLLDLDDTLYDDPIAEAWLRARAEAERTGDPAPSAEDRESLASELDDVLYDVLDTARQNGTIGDGDLIGVGARLTDAALAWFASRQPETTTQWGVRFDVSRLGRPGVGYATSHDADGAEEFADSINAGHPTIYDGVVRSNAVVVSREVTEWKEVHDV